MFLTFKYILYVLSLMEFHHEYVVSIKKGNELINT